MGKKLVFVHIALGLRAPRRGLPLTQRLLPVARVAAPPLQAIIVVEDGRDQLRGGGTRRTAQLPGVFVFVLSVVLFIVVDGHHEDHPREDVDAGQHLVPPHVVACRQGDLGGLAVQYLDRVALEHLPRRVRADAGGFEGCGKACRRQCR